MLNDHRPFLNMKLPGPNGIITAIGDFKKSLEFSSAGANLAYALVVAEEKRQLGRVVAIAKAKRKAPLPIGKAKRANDESAFQSTKDKNKVALYPSDPTKFVVVGAGLSNK